MERQAATAKAWAALSRLASARPPYSQSGIGAVGRGAAETLHARMVYDVAKLIAVISVPWLLPVATGFLTALVRWREHVVFCRRVSPRERASLAMVLVLSLLGVLLAAWGDSLGPASIRTRSYFVETRTPCDAPQYMLRNYFRAYTDERSRSDAAFSAMIHERQSRISRGDHHDATLTFGALEGEPAKLYVANSRYAALERDFVRLEGLSMHLKDKERNRLYMLFGPEAALDCPVCPRASSPSAPLFPKNATDWLPPTAMYALFLLPTVAAQYAAMALSVGIATAFKKKRGWRLAATALILAALLYETYTIIFENAPSSHIPLYKALEDLVASRWMAGRLAGAIYPTRPEQLAVLRSIMFLLTSASIVLVDVPAHENAMLASLAATHAHMETSMSKLLIARIAREVIAKDAALRRVASEYHADRSRLDRSREGESREPSPEEKKAMMAIAKKTNDHVSRTMDAILVQRRE